MTGHTTTAITSPPPGVGPSPIVKMSRQPKSLIPRPSLVFDDLPGRWAVSLLSRKTGLQSALPFSWPSSQGGPWVALGGASRHRPPANSSYHDDPFDAHIATSSVGEPKPKENAMKVAVVGLASLLVVMGSVVLGLLVALGRALSGGRLWRCAVGDPGHAGGAQRDGYGRTGIRAVSRRPDARRSAKT